MNRASARPEAVQVATKDVHAITIGLNTTASRLASAERRSMDSGAGAALAAGAGVLPGSGLDGRTTFGAAGAPSAALRAALIMSAGERPAVLPESAAGAAALAGAAAAGLAAAAAAGAAAAPLLPRIAAMMSAGDFGAAAAGAAAGVVAAGAAGAAALPARIAAMISAGDFGAAAGEAAAVTAGAGSAGVSAAGG